MEGSHAGSSGVRGICLSKDSHGIRVVASHRLRAFESHLPGSTTSILSGVLEAKDDCWQCSMLASCNHGSVAKENLMGPNNGCREIY